MVTLTDWKVKEMTSSTTKRDSEGKQGGSCMQIELEGSFIFVLFG